MEPDVQVIVPLSLVDPAVKSQLEPLGLIESVSVVMLHDGEGIATGVPKASKPLATNVCVVPLDTLAELGEMVMLASGPGPSKPACHAAPSHTHCLITGCHAPPLHTQRRLTCAPAVDQLVPPLRIQSPDT